MGKGIFRDAHTGVGYLQIGIFLIAAEPYRQVTAGNIIFNTVFDQIENNLIQVVLQNQNGGILA